MTQSKDMVYKSNALIEASYRLSAMEQRVLLACITQVQKGECITDEFMYEISVNDVKEMTGSASKSLHKELEDAALKLKRREVWLKEYPNGKGDRPKILVTGWVQTIQYHKGSGTVELRFSKDMLPYLTGLTKHFTRYSISDVAQMNNAHAIRIYELLCEKRDFGQREVEVEWLKSALHLEGKYSQTAELKRRVIDPSIKQINEQSQMWVRYSHRKTGRKVTHIIFKFGMKDDSAAIEGDYIEVDEQPKKRGRGRPRKTDDTRQKRKQISAAIMDVKDTDW